MNKKSRVLLLLTLSVLMASPVMARRWRFFAPPPAPTTGDYQTEVNGRLLTVETTTDDEGNETRSLNRVSLSGDTVITLGEEDVAIGDLILTDEAGETTVNIAVGECELFRGRFFRCTGTATVGEGDDATTIDVRVHGIARTSRRTGVTTVQVSVFGLNRDARALVSAFGRGSLIVEEEPEDPEEPEEPTDDEGEGTPVE